MHEASQHDHNRFLTLTYNEQNLPDNNFLYLPDVQRWLKRLRKGAPNKIRYFLSGEYGTKTRRPHYHVLLFGHRFADEQSTGKLLYSSTTANNQWAKGNVSIGHVTGASAAYVAQYTIKDDGYRPVTADGEVGPRPFITMSRRPGIGSNWLERFSLDLQHGYLVDNGRRGAIPRAYLRRLKEDDPVMAEDIEHLRYLASTGRPGEAEARLEAAERIHHRRREVTASLKL